MQINCPHCGLREESEFVFGRALEGVSDPRNVEPFSSLYLRSNPRGLSNELWQHVGGCRAWLRLLRNTLTHEIARVDLART